jgi:integrase
MASVSFSSGRAIVQFVDADGKRKSIRLGRVSKREAGAIKLRIEALLNSKIMSTPPDRDTATWLTKIGTDLADRLARAGLIAARSSRLLREFIEEYVSSRQDVREATRVSLRVAAKRLVSYFGEGRALDSITPADVDRWIIHLQTSGYAQATIGRTIRRARQLFTAALRAKLIHENPAEGIKAPPQHNPERARFIDRGTIAKVMEVADREWKLILALARYGGIRVPSELEPLRLTDIDFERGRLRITSPKTARHAGKGERWIPLFPELRQHIEEAFETAEEGEVYLVRHPCLRQRKSNVNLRKGLMTLLRKAGLTPWPRLFHNLRASRQTELAATFPSHVVCAWIGNSERIAAAHYLQVTDADFEKATSGKEGAAFSGAVDREALHFPVQSALDSKGQERTQPTVAREVCPLLSPQVLDRQGDKVAPDGLEPSLPGYGPGVFAAGPRDHCSSRGGTRTHKPSPGSRPGRFADLRTRLSVAEAGFEPASNGL